jgi:putative Holliday junction resolvase
MSSIISLDVGKTRIGVAKANTIARLPSPYTTLINGPDIVSQIQGILDKESVGLIVVGLPRSLSGNETEQTAYTRDFAKQLENIAPIVFQDEALTSAKAEKELSNRGKPFKKGDIDALAATYILEDYLLEKGSNT